MAMSDKERVVLTRELQDDLLLEYKKRLKDGSISDSGMANLQRLLQGWGWVVEDEALNDLRSKLTAQVDPSQFSDEDMEDYTKVVGKIA